MSLEDEKYKGFAHHDVAIKWWKKHMFLGFQSGCGTEHSNLEFYLNTVVDNDIGGAALF